MSPRPRHHHRHRCQCSGDRPVQGLAGAVVAALVALLMLTGTLAQPAHLASAHAEASHHHQHGGPHEHEDHDHDERQPTAPTPGEDCVLCHLILTAQGPVSLPAAVFDAPPLLRASSAAPAGAISLAPLRDLRGRAPPATA